MFNQLRCQVVVALAILVIVPHIARAQDRPAPAVDVAAGWVGFADDGIASETMVGAALRWYVGSRFAIGPEVIYIAGDNHSHLVVTGNATFDFVRPINNRPRPITPFAVIGGGLFQTSENFRIETFRSSEGALTMGGGVRVAAGDRVTIGVDARIGWETHVRVNAVAGIRLF
jgi:hypothetical protein